jgi:predicted N-acyltransferase
MATFWRIFKERYNAKNRAYFIAMLPGKYDTTTAVDEFLEMFPKYSDKKNVIIDELQWITVAGGLIAIRTLAGVEKAKETHKQLIEFYKSIHLSNNSSTPFTDEFLSGLGKKLEKYIIRFNRGLAFRNNYENSFNEAIFDVANESMEYFTGKIMHTQISTFEDVFTLQEREKGPDALEMFIRKALQDIVGIFLKKFKEVKIV